MIYRVVGCVLLLAFLLGSVVAAFATPHAPVPAVHAAHTSSEIAVDGHLREPAWQAATPAADFRQLQPARRRSRDRAHRAADPLRR